MWKLIWIPGGSYVLKAASAFDVGKAINPDLVKAQIEGGFVQGLSSAIFEEMRIRKGVMTNPSFVDYRIATSADIPEKIDPMIVEHAQDDGPFGARGIGEHPMVPDHRRPGERDLRCHRRASAIRPSRPKRSTWRCWKPGLSNKTG